jgi:type IV pilus assembly protein PilF
MNNRLLITLACCTSLLGCATESKQPNNLTLPQASPADVYVNLGVKYMQLGKLDIALAKLEKALQIDPRNSEAHNAIAVLYEELKQTDLARAHFKKAVQLRPNNSRAQNNYGRFLCAHKDYAAAEQHFKKAYEAPLNQRPWIALTNAGSCALMAGRVSRAEEYLRKALELNSRFAPALQEMVKVSFKQRSYLSTRAFLHRFESVSKHTPETLWIGIQTEQILGDEEQSAQYKQMLGQQFPTSKEAAQMWKETR